MDKYEHTLYHNTQYISNFFTNQHMLTFTTLTQYTITGTLKQYRYTLYICHTYILSDLYSATYKKTKHFYHMFLNLILLLPQNNYRSSSFMTR